MLIAEILEKELGRAGPLVTEAHVEKIAAHIHQVSQPEQLRSLGVSFIGHAPSVLFTDPNKTVGNIQLECRAPGVVVLFDNRAISSASVRANIRCWGENGRLLFLGLLNGTTNLHNVFLRSPGQTLLWGCEATAVNATIEIEGSDRYVYVGDDCMLSGPVTIRNHDMHSIFDLKDETLLNASPGNITIEQHVWIGQDSLIFNCDRIGFGSVIGASSFLKGPADRTSIYAGTPAKLIRAGASWCRSVNSIRQSTRERLGRLDKLSKPRAA